MISPHGTRRAGVFTLIAVVTAAAGSLALGAAVNHPERVRPLLVQCIACHSGPEARGKLDLTKPGAVVPGKPRQSRLFQMVAAKKMPPGQPLDNADIEVLREWILAGAEWPRNLVENGEPERAGPDWWSLQPVKLPAPPRVRNQWWALNPIDSFILEQLEAEGLKPSPAADRTTLIRRLAFDLTGLPPTPAEIDAFLADESPNAYEKLVDRLLASPHYGERWGRHWLDVVRYGESQGFERDKVRDHAWRYRDYVIQSFNEDKPYPQFIREQIAGDALTPATHAGIVATGFLVAGPWDEVGNSQQSQVMRARVREEDLEDIISTVAQTFLGMTVNCARCHDHKFDPIEQADYYRVKAVFEGVRHGNRPLLTPTEAADRKRKRDAVEARVRELGAQVSILEGAARLRVVARQERPAAAPTVKPALLWTFEAGAREEIAGLTATLNGGAAVSNGRLRLSGKGAFLQSAPLPREIKAKTLEAWVALTSLTQRGGGALSLESNGGRTFDGLVYGEQQPRKWIAGSNSFRRTRDLKAPAESAKPGELIHVAAVYAADNSIQFYRNGQPYGERYTPTGAQSTLRAYPAGEAYVLIGLRHTGAGNGFLAGEIEEARVYDRALSAQEIRASFRSGPPVVTREEMLAALAASERPRYDRLTRQLDQEQAELKRLLAPPMTYAAVASQPGPTHILIRGEAGNLGEQVAGGGLSVIAAPSPDFGLPMDAPESQRRLALAEWIASPENPLTARVMVNRIWHYHFGQGIVASPSDFGFNGERPTHPELLDWLASQFTRSGWSVKKLHKLILMSNTYKQSSRFNARAAEVDVGGRLLWRYPLRRLEGEAVRDAMLSVSGQLNAKIGGPSFRPFTVFVRNSHFYTLFDKDAPEFNRRSVYRINVHSAKSPLLQTLDCPDPGTRTPRRGQTTTPLQSLALMNHSFVLRQADYLAVRLKRERPDHLPAQIRRAYRLMLGRPPTPAERARSAALAADYGLDSLCWALLNSSEFLHVR